MATPTEPKRGRPATGKTTIRHVRIGEVWDEAARIAQYRDERMTDVISRAVEAYVRRHRHEVPDDFVFTPSPKRKLPTPREPVSGAPVGRGPHIIAKTLDTLKGPTSGVVELPRHLDWSGNPTYNLDRPKRLNTMYRTVLTEATKQADLATWLDKNTLLRVWSSLGLSDAIRQPWEERFPELRS